MKIPYLQIKFNNEIELIDKLLKIYDLSREIADGVQPKPLRKFERDILIYYMRYGYSKETKLIIEKDTDKKSNAIIQTDFLLKKAGYLEDSKNNFRMKKLNTALEKIRQDFVVKKNKVYGLHFLPR
jgi:hypothetical protein